MSAQSTIPCRVDFRTFPAESFSETTGRVESLWATGCSIQASLPTAPDPVLELRIYLPDGEWPLIIDGAHITWGHWDSFTVEFVSMPDRDRARLHAYLATDHALEPA